MSRRSNAFGVGIAASLPSSSLPAWADYTALPNGTFREFTLNKPEDIGMQRAVLYNWCGGDFVPDYGARGGVGYCGGGEHVAWTDSSLSGPGQQGAYVLDCDSRLYVRKCYPSANHTGVRSDGAGTPTDDWGAYNDDGSPQAKHTYNGMSYMPASWGGGSSGSLMRVAHTGGISISRGPQGGPAYAPGFAATWRYDLSKAAHTVGDPSIIKLTGSSTYNYGSGSPATTNDASFACIDHTRQGWWSTHRGGSGAGGRMVFTSKTGAISAPQGPAFETEWAMLHHFADDDIIVRFTDHQTSLPVVPIWRVHVWQAGTNNAWVEAPVNRQAIADTDTRYKGGLAYPEIGGMHPRWSSTLGCFVGLDQLYPAFARGAPSTTIRVWKITPPPAGQRFTGTWQINWELVTAVPGSVTNVMHITPYGGDAGTLNNVYGRLVECPSLRAFVWTRDVDKPGQLIRLRGM